MSHFPVFSTGCTCVKNGFKSAATTTVVRFLETISNWRRNEEVDKEAKLLKEDFAKALKRQRLLPCNPGLWSLKEEEEDTV